MVKLNPNITAEKRSFIANGLRSYFRDKETLLYEREEIVSMLKSTGLIFNAFVAIIGAIALTISFFLLLVATT